MSKESAFGKRLLIARKMAGMSLQELSDRLEGQVSKQALSKYEKEAMRPSSGVLLKLSQILSVKPDYFLKNDPLQLGEISFRKKVSLSKKIGEALVERSKDFVERYLELEDILGIVNEFKNPVKNIRIRNRNDVEKAAKAIRVEWKLGLNPITNVVETLEKHGVKILLVEEDDAFDGFAAFSSTGIPVVVVNRLGRSIERIRFTIIHELAHILLNFESEIKNDVKLVEKLCHFFSSCFLLPKEMIVEMIGSLKRSYIAISELIAIKEQFGISLRAILHRLKELQIIAPLYYTKWSVYLTKKYGAKNEPGDFKGERGISLFNRLIDRAISEGHITFSKAAYLANCSINDIRKGFESVEI